MQQLSTIPPTDQWQPTRRYDVDWLRVLGMATVFLFHCARFFDTEDWHVKSPQTSRALNIPVFFAVQWMMPLFFILSGIAIAHVLARRTPREYLASRVRRLAVPLLFGILVIIAPWQVYLERVSHGQYVGSFWRWFPHYFDGPYGLGGNFAWMGVHLWYLEFLFLFSIITLPLFRRLRSPAGRRAVTRFSHALSGPGAIFLLSIPIGAAEFVASTPAIRNTVFGHEGFGGWSALPYLTILIIGYLLGASPALEAAVERHRFAGLLIGVSTFVLGYFVYMAARQWPWLQQELVLSALRGIHCWAWLVAICGFASRHLRFSNRFLLYANEAVLPFYILHQTVILTVGFYLLRSGPAPWLQYFAIAAVSFAAILALYEFLVRRLRVLRFLFGMGPMRPRPIKES